MNMHCRSLILVSAILWAAPLAAHQPAAKGSQQPASTHARKAPCPKAQQKDRAALQARRSDAQHEPTGGGAPGEGLLYFLGRQGSDLFP